MVIQLICQTHQSATITRNILWQTCRRAFTVQIMSARHTPWGAYCTHSCLSQPVHVCTFRPTWKNIPPTMDEVRIYLIQQLNYTYVRMYVSLRLYCMYVHPPKSAQTRLQVYTHTLLLQLLKKSSSIFLKYATSFIYCMFWRIASMFWTGYMPCSLHETKETSLGTVQVGTQFVVKWHVIIILYTEHP